MRRTVLSISLILLATFTVVAMLALYYGSLMGYILAAFICAGYLAFGLIIPEYELLFATLAIPVVSRMAAATVGPGDPVLQQVILASALFSLGASYSYPAGRLHVRFPPPASLAKVAFYVILGVSFAVLAQLSHLAATSPRTTWSTLAFFILYSTIAEEFVFRLVIQTQGLKFLHPATVFILTAILHASLYISSNPLQFLYAYSASIIASTVYLKTKRIEYPILFGFVWKLVANTLFFA
jgi:membrane protease YdiL (CAAX protease family)